MSLTRFQVTDAILTNRSDPNKGSGLLGYVRESTGAVGRSIYDKLADYVSVMDFGATGDGVTDDTQAFTFALKEAEEIGAVVYVPHGTYKITSTLTVDLAKTGICGDRATIDATSFTSGSILLLTGTVNPPYGQSISTVTGLKIIGPGAGVSGVVGVLCNSATASKGPSHSCIRDFAIKSCETGLQFGNRAYCMNVISCDIYACGTCIYQADGVTDAGERLTFIGCTIYNSTLAVRMANANGSMHFVACSLDYNDKQVQVEKGRVFLTDCHVEARDYADSPITVAGVSSTFVMRGGWLSTTIASLPLTASSIVDCTSSGSLGGGARFHGVFMHHLQTSTNKFASGTGFVLIDGILTYNTPEMSNLVGDSQNYLRDGGFELASVVDNIFITEDTAAITSRVTGTNITLDVTAAQARNGSQSLIASKAGIATSAATFWIAVPVKPGNRAAHNLYYKKTGAQTGIFHISTYYGTLAVNASGIPTILTSTLLGNTNITFTTDPVDWTIHGTQIVVIAPHWATHYLIKINMNDIGAGDLYFDDINVGVF